MDGRASLDAKPADITGRDDASNASAPRRPRRLTTSYAYPLPTSNAAQTDGANGQAAGPTRQAEDRPSSGPATFRTTDGVYSDGRENASMVSRDDAALSNGLLPRRQTTSSSQPPRAHPRHGSRARLSLSFPINTRGSAGSSLTGTPSGTPTAGTPPAATTPPVQTTPTPTLESVPDPSPGDGNTFLVALAAQERRVLELKDELRKAESDLDRLKRQWAVHEASRKRSEIRQEMRPLGRVTNGTGTDGALNTPINSRMNNGVGLGIGDGQSGRASLDGPTPDRHVRRKVIRQGHTRALSLLSPPSNHSRPSPDDRVAPTRHRATLPKIPSQSELGSPDTPQPPQQILTQPSNEPQLSPSEAHDAILRSGRQMAEGLRDGFWTFFDDLRQATVGEEAVSGKMNGRLSPGQHGPIPRKQSSRTSLRRAGTDPQKPSDKRAPRSPRATSQSPNASALIDVGGTSWKDQEDSTAPTDTTPDGDWGSWERGTPNPQDKSSRHGQTESSQSGGTSPTQSLPQDTPRSGTSPTHSLVQDTPRTSVSSTELSQRHNPASNGNGTTGANINWPTLASSLSPGNLQRSASSLMADWERSLSPSPDRP